MPKESNRTNVDLLKKAHELGNSRELYAWRLSDYPEVKSALNHVFDEIKSTYRIRADAAKKYRDHVRVIVLDLFVANKNDPSQFITYSRSPNAYSKGTTYARMFLKHRIANNVIEFLIKNDYVENHKGYYRKDRPFDSKKSRMRATNKLLLFLENEHKIEIGMIRWDDREPLLILRDQDGQELPFDDTPTTLAMKENLKLINKNLERHAVLLYVTDRELKALNERMTGDSRKSAIDFTRKWVRRVFSNRSFEQGGRFYGGWWQNIPREYRQFIRINDKDVVERDFSGLHINMLYAMEKIPPPSEDPYQLDGYGNIRGFLKEVLLRLVNAKSKIAVIRSIEDKRDANKIVAVPPEIQSLEKVIDDFILKHSAISKYFGTGIGVELQFLDSQIAEKVLVHFSMMNYAILPMHDSFIIHHALSNELQEAMEKAFFEMFGMNIRVDLKYDSIEVRLKKESVEEGVCDLSLEELLKLCSEQGDYGTYFRFLNQHRKHSYSTFYPDNSQ